MERVSDAEVDEWRKGLDECRTQSVRILCWLQLVVGWALVVPYLVAAPGLGWAILALVVGAILALLLASRDPDAASATVVLSQLLASAAAARALDVGFAGWTFAVGAATATVLLGSGWAIGAALGVTVFLLATAGVPAPWTDGTVLGGIAITWTMVFVSWLGLRPLRQTLEWSLSSHRDARARAEDAERHRGELGRLVKSLNETHERLGRLTLELDRARHAAENARTLKARFAAYISHELRTPLNLIIGFSEMMVMAPHTYGDEVLPASYRGDISAIYQSARHLSTLINDVLDLSQIDAHRMALDRDDVAIGEIIAEAADTVRAAYLAKGLSIRAVVEDGLPVLYLDRTRVRQVLINLLGNALRFTERGGVTITASLVGSDVVTAVRDTGVGIPPDELPRLFDDFRQVERPEEDRGEGSGLGLAIARRFVGLHGGWMKAESQPGQGTVVSFGLPAGHAFVDLDPSSGDHRDSASATTGLPAVAVLDDDPWLLRACQRYLDGYRVLPFSGTGRLAERQWQREGVVALILPAPDDSAGWDELRQLAGATGGVPLVCCSLRGGREAINRLGVVDYLDKPVTRERLAQVLDRYRPRRGAPRTILVVDDDHEMVRLLTRMSHSVSRHFRVLKAYGGAMALDLMRETRPDLVLLDLLMPGVDGYTVLRRMREDAALADVPVAVVTARGIEDDAIVAGMFGLARSGGFPAGELMRCLQATLDNLNAQAAAEPRTEPEAAPAG